MRELMTIAGDARAAKAAVARLDTNAKNAGLHAIADALIEHTAEILAANQLDLDAGRASGQSQAV